MAKTRVDGHVPLDVARGAVRERAGLVLLVVSVKPGAKKTALATSPTGGLLLSVTAPPQDGKANDAVRDAIAALVDVAPSAVVITRGASSREKELSISGVSLDDVVRALAAPT